MQQPFSYNSVYYIEGDNFEFPLDPIAIRPTFFEYRNGDYIEKRCEWNNTGRGANLYIENIIFDEPLENKDQPRNFKILGTKGEVVRFNILTNDIFKERVVENTFGQPVFQNDEDLQQYYLTQKFNGI